MARRKRRKPSRRARESASGDKDAPERLAADFGLWAGSFVRGDLPSMRTHAAAFLAGVAARPDSPEAGVAHRVRGITHWFAGEFAEAREHLERALALFQPGRDDDLAFRFGRTPASPRWSIWRSRHGLWARSDARFRSLSSTRERIAGLSHAARSRLANNPRGPVRLDARRPSRAPRTNVFELARLVREHDLPLFRASGSFSKAGRRRRRRACEGSRTCAAAPRACASRTS